MAKKTDKPKVEKSVDILSNKDMLLMINKRLGEGTIYTFDGDSTVKIQPVSTGIPSLDFALGIGGWPWGRLVELYGPESSGKTTIALKTAAKFQALAKIPGHPFYGKKVVFIDAEHALDPFHAQKLGVDISEETGMLIAQPDCGENAYDLMEVLILSGQTGLIVGDSLPSFIPKKVIDGSAEDNHIGLQARLNSQCLPKMANFGSKNDTLIIMINQIREKVGVMYGNPETTPGGRALKFYSSVRAEVRKKELKKGDVIIGQTMTVSVKKNKVSRPFTKSEFDYYYDTGVDVVKDIMNVAIDMKIIHRRGSYYFLGPDPEDAKNVYTDGAGNELKWSGKDTLEAVLKESPALYQYIDDIVQGRIPKDAQFIEEEHDENEVLEEEMAFEEIGPLVNI
ncbi:DNA recombination/repair protein RecA [Bacillus cereus group sp. BfR-BA-01318]|uniref:DNA recombination/repair protein RecA n=1 Tax=Bacillus cereus group sp. BfR-BA-01318 TaxID=2920295 RepID=UPI001F589608|nr:DNA recombination/repair protein RecA [Bacillus cereus group sp. BfR-BA-01318]